MGKVVAKKGDKINATDTHIEMAPAGPTPATHTFAGVVDDEVAANDVIGEIEAVKAVAELYAPLSGKIVEVNENLQDDSSAINGSPYEDGWMIKVQLSDKSELDGLLSAEGYAELTAAE